MVAFPSLVAALCEGHVRPTRSVSATRPPHPLFARSLGPHSLPSPLDNLLILSGRSLSSTSHWHYTFYKENKPSSTTISIFVILSTIRSASKRSFVVPAPV